LQTGPSIANMCWELALPGEGYARIVAAKTRGNRGKKAMLNFKRRWKSSLPGDPTGDGWPEWCSISDAVGNCPAGDGNPRGGGDNVGRLR